jgi:hypothetical protein
MSHSLQKIEEKNMAKSSDWMPGVQWTVLTMYRNWISYLTEAWRTAWGVPQAEFTELVSLHDVAEALLDKAENEDERTHVITSLAMTAKSKPYTILRVYPDGVCTHIAFAAVFMLG